MEQPLGSMQSTERIATDGLYDGDASVDSEGSPSEI